MISVFGFLAVTYLYFVVDKKVFKQNVAQHSPNYLRWASSPDNSWDKLEDEGYTYGVVR